MSREQMWSAAALAAGKGAVVSHGTAALHWAFSRVHDPGAIDILVEGKARPSLEGVRGHRTTSLPDGHRTVHRHLPVTTPDRSRSTRCAPKATSTTSTSYPDVMQAFEWDTFTYHGGLDPFHGDRDRFRRLQRAGWQVWPITGRTSQGEILAIVDEFVSFPRHERAA